MTVTRTNSAANPPASQSKVTGSEPSLPPSATPASTVLAVPTRPEMRARPLVSARVYLTPLEGSDAGEMLTCVNTSRVSLAAWLPWVPFVVDHESAFRFADASATDWDHGRACRFTIREHASRALLGVLSLEALSQLHRSCDLGYWLRHDCARRGYMTEAATSLLEWTFGRMQAHRVRALAATENHASLRVLQRLEFRFEGVARQAELCGGRWLDHAMFARVASDRYRLPAHVQR
jgi:ribosomal-protein-serine acetyltransferase